jgi:hypothetical protein
MIKRLYEMANLRPSETGINIVVYADQRDGLVKHAARIKVSKIYGDKTSQSLFPITIEDNPRIIGNDIGEIKPKDIRKIIGWIKLNQQLLLDYWYRRITTTTFINGLRKIV